MNTGTDPSHRVPQTTRREDPTERNLRDTADTLTNTEQTGPQENSESSPFTEFSDFLPDRRGEERFDPGSSPAPNYRTTP